MPEEKQLSTASNNAVAVPTKERLQKCPVAQRLYDRTCDGFPMAAVAVVAAADRSITTATESVRSTGQVSVKRFAKDFDERTLAALILTHLTIVEDMVNVARPMKPEAMAMISKEVAQMLAEEIAADEPSLIISKAPCPLQIRRRLGPVRAIAADKCKRCGACLKCGCPAIVLTESGGRPSIDPQLCAGCRLCESLCKFGAIAPVESEAPAS